mmetsp:Transcript_4314/g.19627  ORF Transcript_4314/g.19627 Transcript_4314/m.19627 type:complete len:316 (+) Transcript_4314:1083-2030(+)
MPVWLFALFDWSSLAIIPVYRVCAAMSAVTDWATLPPRTEMSVMTSLVQPPVMRVHRKVMMATIASDTLMSISLNLTVTFTSGKIISRSAMGMSWKDLRMRGPAPPGPALRSSAGLAMRYIITTSLKVGSWSSIVLKRFLRIAKGLGSRRRRVRRSMTVTSCLSSSINPLPAPSFLTAAVRFFPAPPRGANTVLGLPTIASRGSMMHISRNISTFSMMNRPFAFATPLPRLNSKAESANWVRPWLRAGFCLRKVPRSSLSNLSQAMSHGSVNMKSSAFARSHSFCVNNEKLASAMSVQKSLTKSTDTSRNSEGLI